MGKTFTKSLVIVVLIFMSLVSVFAEFPSDQINAKALSVPTTGVRHNGLTTNEGACVSVGTFDIFATDLKIVFYNQGDSSLAKTYDIVPIGGNTEITRIAAFNNTHLLVVTTSVQRAAPNTNFYWSAGFLAVNSLQWTLINSGMVNHETDANQQVLDHNDMVLFQTGDKWYVYMSCFVHSYANHLQDYYTRCYRVTSGAAGSWLQLGTSNSQDVCLDYASITVPTSTVGVVNIITKEAIVNDSLGFSNSIGSRYVVLQVNVNSWSASRIGIGPVPHDWSSYVYKVDWVRHGTAGNEWTDVMVAFSSTFPGSPYDSYMMVIRFNSTYVNGFSIQMSFPFGVGVVKLPCFIRVEFGVLGNGTLMNGVYDFIYLDGDASNFYRYPFKLSGLESETPSLQPNGVPVPFHYKAVADVNAVSAGLMSPYGGGTMFEFGVTGSVWGEHFPLMYPSSSLVLSFRPTLLGSSGDTITPNSYVDDDFSCYVTYSLSATFFVGGVAKANGSFMVFSTGLGLTPAVWTETADQYLGSGAMTNGHFEASLTQRQVLNQYEGLMFQISADGTTSYFYIRAFWNGSPESGGSDGSGGGGSDGGGGADGSDGGGWFNSGNWVDFIVIFIITFVPACILAGIGAKGGWGMQGFMGGLILGLGAATAAGMVPYWFIALIGMLLILLIMGNKR